MAAVCLALAVPPSASAAGSGAISGRVYRADGTTPVPGIQVRLWVNNSGSWTVQAQTTSLANGAYAFTALLNKTFAVEFRDATGAFVPEFYDDREAVAVADATPIVLGIGENRTGVHARLDDAGSISGVLTDSEGLPASGVTVNLYRHLGGGAFESLVAASAVSQADGSYSVRGLAAGAYAVHFWSGTYAPQYHSETCTQGATSDQFATPVTVPAATAVDGIDAAMLDWGHIEGTVRSADGPVGNAVLMCYRAEDTSWVVQPVAMTQSLADGTFATERLYPGRYRVRVSAAGFPVQYDRSALEIGWGRDTVVSTGETSTLDTVLVVSDTRAAESTVAGVPGDWTRADVVASLSATDGADGSGVGSIRWALDAGASSAYAGPVTVSAAGVHELSFRSVDCFGNVEVTRTATVRIDRTPPLTLHDAPPVAVGVAEITLTPGDGESGVAETAWTLDGGPPAAGCAVRVSAPGEHVLRFASTDRAGNEEGTVTVAFEVVPRRYEDGDAALGTRGPWSTLWRSFLSGGSIAYSGASNASLDATFSGTGVEVVGARTTSSGHARFYVDGVLVSAADLYASPNRYGQTVFVAEGLAEGVHTLRVEAVGRKNVRAVGTNVFVDCLDVHGELMAP